MTERISACAGELVPIHPPRPIPSTRPAAGMRFARELTDVLIFKDWWKVKGDRGPSFVQSPLRGEGGRKEFRRSRFGKEDVPTLRKPW